jgi:DNA invertase Pin-like site-specific DNA recombinase
VAQSVPCDTSTDSAIAKLVLHLMSALADYERTLTMERSAAGREAARKRGVKFGRPLKLTAHQGNHARELREAGKSANEIGNGMFPITSSGSSWTTTIC